MIEHTLRKVDVLDSHIAYHESGPEDGPAVLFLHGNPTSSFIWRNIIPHVAERARCIAPDLIGFGGSGKPNIEYRFFDHARYLEGFISALGLGEAYLVVQDWGTALAFHLAAEHPDLVKGLAFMEFIRPMRSWEEFHQTPEARGLFQKLRTPGVGEKLIFEDNIFVERVLQGSVVRKLSDEEMMIYREPFATVESRLPTWRFANELPIAGEPADVNAALERAHEALARAEYPKLLFVGDPGALISPAFAEEFAERIPNCRLVRLGSGEHYLQEDHPDTIGKDIADFIIRAESSRAAAQAGG